jgi:hypothetical protein
MLAILTLSAVVAFVDDKPTPTTPPAAKKTEVKKVEPAKKTSPADWPKNAKNIPVPPKDWITVERFDAPKKLAIIRLQGEEKSRTVKVGSGVARDVKVSEVNPVGRVTVKLKDGTRVDYYQAGREKKVKEQDWIKIKSEGKHARQSEKIRRRNGQ